MRVCTLYYGTDENLNFYLVTDPNSEHGKMLEKNKRVAFNIFDSHTKITQPKKGIQGKGDCSQVKDWKEVAKGLMLCSYTKYSGWDSNPHDYSSVDFKSTASAIPPPEQDGRSTMNDHRYSS